MYQADLCCTFLVIGILSETSPLFRVAITYCFVQPVFDLDCWKGQSLRLQRLVGSHGLALGFCAALPLCERVFVGDSGATKLVRQACCCGCVGHLEGAFVTRSIGPSSFVSKSFVEFQPTSGLSMLF